ncbi:MAG: ABC-2 family transporter protein [Chloroflexi bacterium]|nr:ABC-2 family transporter protein [Chloroflexota bacterium]
MHQISVYGYLALAYLRGRAQYRVNFLTMVIAGLVYQGTGFIFIWALLSRFHTIAGWTLSEVAFLYGIRLTVHGLSVVIFGNLARATTLVREGELDRLLARPMSPFLQLMASCLQATSLGDLLGGLGLLTASLLMLHRSWSPPAVIYLVLGILGGTLVDASFRLIPATLSFRLLNTSALTYIVDDFFSNFSNYPLTIFGKVGEVLLTFVLPLAFVAYFPASVILGHTQGIFIPKLIAELAPLAGIIYFSLAYRFWKSEIRRYQSAGH